MTPLSTAQMSREARGGAEARASLGPLLDSFEARWKAVGALMERALQALRGLREEQDRTLGGLRDLLARKGSLRRKDFDAMMGAIRSRRREGECRAEELVGEFLRRGQLALGHLRRIVSDGHGSGPGEREALARRVLAEQEPSERAAREALRDLHLEQEELGAALRTLLARERGPRVRDLKALARTFRTHQSLAGDEVGRILRELNEVREEVAARWRALPEAATGAGPLAAAGGAGADRWPFRG